MNEKISCDRKNIKHGLNNYIKKPRLTLTIWLMLNNCRNTSTEVVRNANLVNGVASNPKDFLEICA